MTKSLRDQHLEEYFPADILKQLDVSEKNVLYDEFSNSELRLLGTQELETIKSQTAKHLQAEYARRLSNIKEDEYPMLKAWYMEIAKSVHEIICTKCGAVLGLEVDTKDDSLNPSHHEGKFVVAVGDKMYSYRPRLDGVMGYQCGNITDVSKDEAKKIKADYDKLREKRRPQLVQEITKRFENDFNEGMKNDTKRLIDDKSFPEVTSKAKAEKVLNRQPLGDEAIKNAVEINLNNELPEIEVPEKLFCGNDTRWAQIEIDNIPQDHVMTSVSESDIVKVKQEMNITGYEPDVKQTKTGYTVESFELREVKS